MSLSQCLSFCLSVSLSLSRVILSLWLCLSLSFSLCVRSRVTLCRHTTAPADCCARGVPAGHPARCQAIGQNGRGASGDGTPCALNAEESDCASTACVDGACAPGVDGADCGPGTDEATCVAITNPDAPDATCVWTAGNEGACGMGQCQYVEKYLAPDSTCVSYKDCHTHKDMATQVWHSDRGAYNGGGRGSAGGSGGGGATDIRLVADDLDSRVRPAARCWPPSGGPGPGPAQLSSATTRSHCRFVRPLIHCVQLHQIH